MRKAHVTDKHAVNYFITYLNNTHSEPVRETQHILVLSRSYIHKTITINFQDPKRCFEEVYLTSFSVEIALKICNLLNIVTTTRLL